MGLSLLGIFHTIIGIAAIVAAFISLFRSGKIDLGLRSGKVYFYATLVTAVTAFGFTKHGFNPGHVLSLLVIALVVTAYALFAKKPASNTARYWENFCLSFSLFLSLIPTANETLTRIPVGKPLANGPGDPLVGKTLLVILLLFIAGTVYQVIRQRRINKIS